MRATLDLKVTSNEPLPVAVVCDTLEGDTDALPTLAPNGTSNLSPSNPTPCWTRACRPFEAGAATISSLPPVAVLKIQIPLPMNVFWLFPTVFSVYGANTGRGAKSWNSFVEGPNRSVSRSVYGAASFQVASVRNSVPFGTSFGTLK